MKSFPLKILAVTGVLLLAVAGLLVVAEQRTAATERVALAQTRGEGLAAALAAEMMAGEPQLSKLAPPGTELYLLDEAGAIVASSLPRERIVRRLVDPAPVGRFLQKNDAAYPLLGDDPKTLHGKAIFSAAPMGDRRLYVLLPAPSAQLFSPLGGEILVMLAVFAAAGGLIAWVSLGARDRLRRLAEEMELFQRTLSAGTGSGRGDEVDRIGAALAAISLHVRDQAEQLRQAEAMRRDLVASVAHDLRTPLASLRGYLETLLLRRHLLEAEEQLTYLQTALRQSEHLQTLITGLFDLVKLEGGETQLNPEPLQVAELVQDVVLKLVPSARRNGVSLCGSLSERVPFIYGDVGLLERVFENVLDNAIRYTPSGGRVSLSVSAAPDAVEVEISDTGRGIPPGDIPHIFERFYRVDKSRNRESGGVGLGLTIAKQIIDMHSGQIAVSSHLGAGTSFTITLPMAAGANRGRAAA
jgi:signal transduction histidine kinase